MTGYHARHTEVRRAVRRFLEARVSPDLFAESQLMRLVIASGENLRDLFAMALDAGENALTRDSDGRQIRAEDTTKAINIMRREYRMRLGASPYDQHKLSYEEKTTKLKAVYGGAPSVDVPDAVLYSLLRARAIQEFNGEGWYGVHPLVVDLLKEQ
jgi:hypothetical protein